MKDDIRYSLGQIKTVMQQEGIGHSSTRYVIETLQKIKPEVTAVEMKGHIQCDLKKMPTWDGVPVTPSSNNNVSFDHKGERCQLHFLTNGNIAVSKDSNKNSYIEINKEQLMELILSKF